MVDEWWTIDPFRPWGRRNKMSKTHSRLAALAIQAIVVVTPEGVATVKLDPRLADPRLSLTERYVLQAFHESFDGQGEGLTVHVSQLARNLSCSESVIRDALAALDAYGLVHLPDEPLNLLEILLVPRVTYGLSALTEADVAERARKSEAFAEELRNQDADARLKRLLRNLGFSERAAEGAVAPTEAASRDETAPTDGDPF